MPIAQEKLDELEAKYKRIAYLKGKEESYNKDDGSTGTRVSWECVFRRPSRAEYKQFRSMSHNPSQVADAQEILARKCVLIPEPKDFDALLEDWPGIPEAATKAFTELTGISAQEDLK